MGKTNSANYGLVETKHKPDWLEDRQTRGVSDEELDAAQPSEFHDIMFITEHATYWLVMWRSNRYAAGRKPLEGGAEPC